MVEAGREQLLDAMLNGLLSTDDEGRVRYLNRRARELFGNLDPTGLRIDEFVTLPAGSTALTRALIEGRATLRAEGLLARESETGQAESLPVRVNLTPLCLPDGTIRGAVCVLEDRSDVHALENEVRHLDTLAALGRFASGLAHEVRNPLGGIQAGVEFLEQTGEFTGEVREHLRVIQGEVGRVDSILMDLLTVARPREVVAGPVDPVELARSVIAGFASLAENEGIQLRIDALETGEEIYVDEQMIRQVLVNLVKNAIEASPTGGVVELKVTPPDARDASRARAGFVVRDRGAGFTDEDRQRAFEPFFTRKSQGTGLGLYVSHGFVERHGGRLRIEDRPGGGTNFCVDLPRVTALVGG
jgi:signal transduction histidine kinase